MTLDVDFTSARDFTRTKLKGLQVEKGCVIRCALQLFQRQFEESALTQFLWGQL